MICIFYGVHILLKSYIKKVLKDHVGLCIGLDVLLTFIKVTFKVGLGHEQREGNSVSRN